METGRKDLEGVNNRRQIEKRLEEYGQDMLHIPDLDIKDSRYQGEAQGKEKYHQHNQGYQKQIPGEAHPENGHKHKKNHGQDQMIDEAGQDTGQGKENLGDVDLFDQTLIVDDGAGGNQHGLLDHKPGCKAGEEKNRVVVHLELDDPGKNQSQDQKKKQGVEDRPEEAQNRISVAQLKLGPHQIPQQLPIIHNFPQVPFHLSNLIRQDPVEINSYIPTLADFMIR